MLGQAICVCVELDFLTQYQTVFFASSNNINFTDIQICRNIFLLLEFQCWYKLLGVNLIFFKLSFYLLLLSSTFCFENYYSHLLMWAYSLSSPLSCKHFSGRPIWRRLLLCCISCFWLCYRWIERERHRQLVPSLERLRRKISAGIYICLLYTSDAADE